MYTSWLETLQGRNNSLATACAIMASAATLVLTVMALLVIAGLDFIPALDSSWSAPWERLARPPSYYQADALAALSRTVFLVAAGCASVASLSLMVHVLSRLIAGWKPLAIRCALGASYRQLVGSVMPGLLSLAAFGSIWGILGGVMLVMLQRASRPAMLLQPGQGALWLLVPAAICALGLLLALVVLPLILLLHQGRGLRADLVGEQVTSSGLQLRLQSALATLQLAALLVVTYGGAIVLRASPLHTPREVILDTSDATTMPLHFPVVATPRQRADVIRELAARVAVASPDAWIGLGKSLEVVAICGGCFVGQNLSPINYGHGRAVAVAPGTLERMGIGLQSGRAFAAGDDLGAAPVVVISRRAAQEMFPRGDPVGKVIRTGLRAGDDYTVIGVVGDLAPRGLGASGKPLATMYFSALQHPPQIIEVAIPADADSAARAWFAAFLRRSGDQAIAQSPDRPIAQSPDRPIALITRLRAFAAPLSWFARVFALLMVVGGALSLYAYAAVMMQLAAIRRRDIAIRLALGARPGHVLRWVTGRGVLVALYGMLIGASAARLTGDVLRRSLSRSDEGDVVTLIALIAGFALIGTLASLLPARRASRTDPAVIWRER